MTAEHGELVSSGGFRVDRSRALEKLSAFQLEDGHKALLALVRCAVASKATQVRIERDGGWRLSFDGAPLSKPELDDPFAALFAEDPATESRSRQLAVGLLGLMGVSREPVDLSGGDGPERRHLKVADPASWAIVADAADQRVETTLRFAGGFVDRARLAADCLASPIAVYLGETELRRARRPDEPGVYFEEAGRYGWVSVPAEPSAASKVGLHVLGTRIAEGEVPTGGISAEGYVNDDAFALDASQSSIVRNERYEATGEIVGKAARRLVAETIARLQRDLPTTGRLVVWPFFAAAWRQAVQRPRQAPYFEDGLFGSAVLLVQRAMGADMAAVRQALAGLRWHADCCRWLRHLARSGAAVPGLEDAPVFLTADGGTASLSDFKRWTGEGRRVQGWKSLAKRGAPRSVWCSTREEQGDLRALTGGSAEIQ